MGCVSGNHSDCLWILSAPLPRCRHFISGGLAGVGALLLTHPLDGGWWMGCQVWEHNLQTSNFFGFGLPDFFWVHWQLLLRVTIRDWRCWSSGVWDMKSHGVTKWEIWLEAAGFRCCWVPLLRGSAAGFCWEKSEGQSWWDYRVCRKVSWCTAHLVENGSLGRHVWHSVRGEFHQEHT